MPATTSHEPIRSGEVYTLEEFRRRAGMGRHAYRMAKKAGLRVVNLHNRVYVRGADWLSYIDATINQATTDNASENASR